MLTPKEAYHYLKSNDIDEVMDLNEQGDPCKWFFDTRGILCLERDRNSTIEAFNEYKQ